MNIFDKFQTIILTFRKKLFFMKRLQHIYLFYLLPVHQDDQVSATPVATVSTDDDDDDNEDQVNSDNVMDEVCSVSQMT